MDSDGCRAIAIVGTGAVLPDAPNVLAFWENVKQGRYCISEVTPDRWDPALYYDADPKAPDKTYSKIGGWVREYAWEPGQWRLPIPPRVVEAMDQVQQWALCCAHEALEDYGHPQRPLDLDRTAVILGSAMGGEKHYLTAMRAAFPEYARELDQTESFASLPAEVRQRITRELHARIGRRLPPITEDSMPGELVNCIAGRIANLYNIRGPNYVADAACASAMAAISAAVEGLREHDFDAALTGGIDRNMGAATFVKFCKIGALSGTGSRPYDEAADGFVMGEGGAFFVLKRLADAERDGDKIYAVLRGVGGSSDGRGKGITAPNPAGQKLCVERAWENAALSPATATYFEGHGTSTRVGDVVEAECLGEVLSRYNLPAGSVALGSVKSNIGHLKGAAAAAGLLKTALALRDKVLPPSLNCEHPNPNIDFGHLPLYVNRELKPWPASADGVRRAGVSAFGFGGTNFHTVLEEYVPHTNGNGKRSVAVHEIPPAKAGTSSSGKVPLRGVLVVGGATEAALAERIRSAEGAAGGGRAPTPAAPFEADLRAPERIVIDFGDSAELADKSAKALQAIAANQPAVWKALRAQGIFRGGGPAPKVAFLYPGQGSQYLNMLRTLRAAEPIVAETFAEADRVMTPLLGKPLTDYIYLDQPSEAAEKELRQTAITQPAVLAADIALTRLLAAYGIEPGFAMGHSLGEYGALVAAGVLSFADALEAVSARGREMTWVSMADNGRMAAIFAPLAEIERTLKTVDGYVVIANINSTKQGVIGGASAAVERAMELFQKAGYNVVPLEVSHAFHTSIVAPASDPLRRLMQRLQLRAPRIPVVANANGELYPSGPEAASQIPDLLALQVASPVQFVKGLETLYDNGARVFVELGPKKALQGLAEDVLGDRGDVVTVFTNHPKVGDLAAFNQALCGLYAAGLGRGRRAESPITASPEPVPVERKTEPPAVAEKSETLSADGRPPHTPSPAPQDGSRLAELGRMFADVLERGWQIYRPQTPSSAPPEEPVVITGAALGLPGAGRVFDTGNVGRILRGEQFIDVVPTRLRRAMLDKHVTRLVKSDNGGPTFEAIEKASDVIRLAGRSGEFDPEKEFGIPAERLAAFDRTTRLAVGVGLDALRDAGIPLVLRYKTTTKGTQLPDRWVLPEALRDETGVIFASCFPGMDSFAVEASRYYADRLRREQLEMLESLRSRGAEGNGHATPLGQELDRRIGELRAAIAKEPYAFDRRFVFRIIPMGHSQFAEFIGARGPNTGVNTACASTTQAVAVAQDWIRTGRCRRVIVIAADDVTSDNLMEWVGTGFLATGAAATDEVVEEAALPFDRRRHGLILGMGAAALVVETVEAARERGLQPICEVLGAVTANSAFHGTRLDVEHIRQVMESLVAQAEQRHGIARREVAAQTVFVSHETYTPARGGSASAEIHALRRVFGEDAERIVIANTKGFTGHPMGAGVEDVVAVKALETGCVPPVANFKEVDPELGKVNLSKGGAYPIRYALRLGAGFGSQISMTLLRWLPTKDEVHRSPDNLGYTYRIVDSAAWSRWLGRMAGHPAADLEVVHHTLRIRAGGATERPAESVQEVQVAAPPASPPPPTVRLPEVQPVTPAPSAPPPPPPGADTVKERVLSLVAEKTGYPVEMLDPDLDLEADLGVDTVKQAEVFAAVREAYGIPRDEKLKLRDFPTLAHVVRFVHERRPDLAAGTPPAAVSPAPSPAAQVAGDGVKERILALVAEKTGYPVDMLDPGLDLEADLGIDTVKQAEVFAAVREIYAIPRDDSRRLRDYPTLEHVIRFVRENSPTLATAPPAAAPVPTAPIQTASSDALKDKVLEIVAAKTGYPKEMLDLDLDLEADLGIDTVKQAEVFAAVREAYGIPRDEKLKLRDFPTLAKVIQFALERRPSVKAETPAEPVTSPATPAPSDLSGLEATARIPRRIPVVTVRPPLNLCRQTGVSLNAGSRVVVMPDEGGVANVLVDRLKARNVDALVLEPAAGADALAARLTDWLAEGRIQGVYWLPALDAESPLSEMDFESWRTALRVRVKSLYATMRLLYPQIAEPGTFLVSATRLGGRHGYDAAGATAPLGGAVTGFTKAYKRERIDALVKAVDFEEGREAAEVAEVLIQETLGDPGAVEIGYAQGQRWTIRLEEQPVTDGRPGMALGRDTVFVVTGAAGSIVSAITADLAAASGGAFYLLDLAPEPDAENPDLKRFGTDNEGLQRDLFARAQARGERATPALVQKEMQGLERAQAALKAINAVRAAGGTARYFSLDITDAGAVARVIEEVRRSRGRIDVLLHGAGIERSHMLPDKDTREFDLVFDIKSDGWFNVIRACGDMPVAATVVFSSIAARFGNGGQTDYSAANDLLCKIASNFRTTRPTTRAIAIDWTAWRGIGMASRGSIPKMMELAGIDMLPPEVGIPWIRRELTAGGSRGEVVVAQGLGVLLREIDPAGGLDTAAPAKTHPGPMAGGLAGVGVQSGLSIETTLNPAAQPFLDHHRIDGVPVLPGVMGIEAFAEAALSILPGWRLEAIKDVEFRAPFKFYRDQPRTFTIETSFRLEADRIVADCALLGRRSIPNQQEPQLTTHFTGRVLLTRQTPKRETATPPGPAKGGVLQASDIYRLYFHGPAYQVLDRAWRQGPQVIGQMAARLPDNHNPPAPTILEPRLIELCLQTAGVWEMGELGRMALPQHIDRLDFFGAPEQRKGPFYAMVTPAADGASFNAEVVDANGNLCLRLSGYRTTEIPGDIDAERRKPVRSAMREGQTRLAFAS